MQRDDSVIDVGENIDEEVGLGADQDEVDVRKREEEEA